MSQASVLDAVEQLAAQKTAEADSQYRALVKAVATGAETPPAEDVAAVIQAAGRKPADLRAAVDRFHARTKLREVADAGDVAKVERLALAEKITTAETRFQKQKAQHEHHVGELRHQKQLAEFQADAGERAVAELLKTADPRDAARLKKLSAQIGALQPDRWQAADRVARLEKDAQRPDIQDGPGVPWVLSTVDGGASSARTRDGCRLRRNCPRRGLPSTRSTRSWPG